MSTQTINAIQVHDYGDVNQLKLEQIARPEPLEGEVLVRVHTELLNTFAQLIDDGQIKAFAGATFPLSEASKAHELSQSRYGRIILRIS